MKKPTIEQKKLIDKMIPEVDKRLKKIGLNLRSPQIALSVSIAMAVVLDSTVGELGDGKKPDISNN